MLNIPVKCEYKPMMDSDFSLLLLLLVIVAIALLAPPGPGTPLRSRVPLR